MSKWIVEMFVKTDVELRSIIVRNIMKIAGATYEEVKVANPDLDATLDQMVARMHSKGIDKTDDIMGMQCEINGYTLQIIRTQMPNDEVVVAIHSIATNEEFKLKIDETAPDVIMALAKGLYVYALSLGAGEK